MWLSIASRSHVRRAIRTRQLWFGTQPDWPLRWLDLIPNPDDRFALGAAAFPPLPLEGGGRRAFEEREPGGGEAEFTPPRQLAKCSLPTLPVQEEGEARVMLSSEPITRIPYETAGCCRGGAPAR